MLFAPAHWVYWPGFLPRLRVIDYCIIPSEKKKKKQTQKLFCSCLKANKSFLDSSKTLFPTFNVGKQVQHVVRLAGVRALSLIFERLIAVPHSDHVATSSLKDCRKIYYIVSFQNCSAAKPIQGDEVTLTELYSFISSFILPFFFF